MSLLMTVLGGYFIDGTPVGFEFKLGLLLEVLSGYN